jgi:predicted dehydrogenase
MARHRAGIIGLGWMGMLYDMAERPSADREERYDLDLAYRPAQEGDVEGRFYIHEHLGREGVPTTYAEALRDRPDVDIVAGADRNEQRLEAFGQRYGVGALYTDSAEMLRREKLDVVAIATNVEGRADLTCLAVECGAKGIMTEKPMATTLEEADRMVKACADAAVPLCCGAVNTTHPSFARAKELVESGAIGRVLNIEAEGPGSQLQSWSYFLDGRPSWVVGIGDGERREGGSDEFIGEGMMVTADSVVVHFRRGAPQVRVTGTEGELHLHHWRPTRWKLWQETETPGGSRRVETPWPEPQIFQWSAGAAYGLTDVFECMDGRLDEPKVSGRRVARALEVEIAMKLSSARGGARIDLPLRDRSLGLNYDWYR